VWVWCCLNFRQTAPGSGRICHSKYSKIQLRPDWKKINPVQPEPENCRSPHITADQPNFRFRWPQITLIHKYRTADHHRSPRSYTYREWWSLWWDEWSAVLLDVTVICGYLNVKLCFHAIRQVICDVRLTENVDLWLAEVLCGSILAACGHLRDKSDHT